ncbi:MAG: LacI family transcriptional regulator [Firmicutes bacterium]|nr:LacI family transcriptional regulator [Bacillota bacterium]
MSVTIKDVAKEANVSISTVSRVLRNQGYFSEDTKRKVLKATKKLNYRVNTIGQSLRSKRTKVLGHVSIGGALSPFQAEIVKGIDYKAYEEGYQVIVCNTGWDKKLEREQIDILLERRVDGIILTNPASKENIEYLKDQKFPFVMVEDDFKVDGIDKVVIDNKKLVYKAVNYLFEQGHRKVVFVGRLSTSGIAEDRIAGYKLAHKDNNFELINDYILLGEDFDVASGKSLIHDFFSRDNSGVTAIVVTTDIMLLGVMQALYYLDKKIPDDISIMGLNDLLTPYLAPPVTSVAQPVMDMGKAAVELLLKRIEDPDMSSTIINLGTCLVERDTVKSIIT